MAPTEESPRHRSRHPSPPVRASIVAALALLAALAWLSLAWLRPGLEKAWGDSPTYLAMTGSLAHDRDLRFDERDLDRERAAGRLGAETLILEKTAKGVVYSKPVLYPLLATPFLAIFGDFGLVLLNVMALAAGLTLAWAYLSRLGPAPNAALTLLTFAATGAVLPYLLWRMTEAVEVGLVLAGLVLALASSRAQAVTGQGGLLARLLDAPTSPLIGSFLLGLAGSLRYPNLALAAAPALAALFGRRPGRAVLLAASAAAGFALVLVLTLGLTGVADPYRAVRSGFNLETGYPAGPDAARAVVRFHNPATLGTNLVGTLAFDDSLSAYATLYFLVGRHTGMLLYCPAALVFAMGAARRRNLPGLSILFSVAILTVFYQIWMPEYFFGGGAMIGNRYFLPGYAALVVALVSLPSPRVLALAWGVAGITYTSAAISVVRTRAVDTESQSHANAGIFRWFPYESTAPELDGRRDRYWSGDFVRFTDPYAEVHEWWFRIASTPAEMMVASQRRGGEMVVLVQPDAGGVILEYRDWRRQHSYPIASASQIVHIEPAPAWRRHPFWWARGVPYQARTFRLSVHGPDGLPAGATIRYLGDGKIPDVFSRIVLAAEVPGTARTGSRVPVRLRIRNSSRAVWTRNAPLPTAIGYRLVREGETDTANTRWVSTPLSRPVSPGETLAESIAIDFAATPPGRYLLEIDMVLDEIAWFADKTGSRVATGTVVVTP